MQDWLFLESSCTFLYICSPYKNRNCQIFFSLTFFLCLKKTASKSTITEATEHAFVGGKYIMREVKTRVNHLSTTSCPVKQSALYCSNEGKDNKVAMGDNFFCLYTRAPFTSSTSSITETSPKPYNFP